MAFIFLPVAFVYLLPAAIFFWLSKDVIVTFAKKPFEFVASLFNKVANKTKDISAQVTVKRAAAASGSTTKKVSSSNVEDLVSAHAPEPDMIEATEQETDEQETEVQETVPEADKTDAEADDEEASKPADEASDIKTEPQTDEEEDSDVKVAPKGKAATAVGEQMTIDEAVEEEPVATPPAPPMQYEDEEKVPVDILAGAKRGFSSAFGKVKSLTKSSKIDDRSDESDYGYIDDGADESRGKVGGWISSRKNDDFKDLDSSDVEEVIKKQFDTLDMITTSAIGIMLSDTKTKAASPYIRDLKKPDIRVILLKFCQDSYFATDMEQLNKLFNKSYYKWKITRYLGKVTVFVKRGIGDSLPRRSALSKARVTKNRFITKICETINTFESVKYISALSGNEEISDTKRNYKLDHLSENYKDALIYLVDLLLTCTCISKMLFVERMIRSMDENSEFNKIITNMAQSIDNHNLIISKSRPIYKQYYQAELGYINGDDLLYGMAITIMVNRVKKVGIKNTEILQINKSLSNTREFKQDMLKWLDGLSRNDAVDDIGTLILQKITLSIQDNYGLLTNALQELTNWENYYDQRVAYYKKERDKERYLKGDFEKEKEEVVKIR